MKHVLVTGGAGFIGSNFVSYFLKERKDVCITVLDLLTYAGNMDNLNDVSDNPRFQFVKGDICDRQLVNRLFDEHKFTGVVHLAAESHVDNSIESPDEFVRTNVMGTFVLLDVAKRKWQEWAQKDHRFLQVSTDEVYGSLGAGGFFTEETPYAPNSPYSATKAGADMLVRSYYHTYGMDVVTTNCSNNFGPKQHFEKLIPTIISKALSNKDIPIYGDGSNVRDWLFVEDHCAGLLTVFEKGKSGETYNIGGDCEFSNLELAKKVCSMLDSKKPRTDGNSYSDQISFVKDRLGHDFRYAIDAAKIKSELNWMPKTGFNAGMEITIDWYLARVKNKVGQTQ